MLKQFLIKLLLFCSIPIPFLYLIQYFTDNGLRRSRYDNYAEWNDIFDGKINADLLIMGSSRAWVHISPAILDSILHINTYNLGLNGWTFSMQNVRFKVYLAHNNKPKYIIHSVDAFLLGRRADLYQYQQFLPYLNDSIIVNASKGYKGEFTFLHKYFPLYKYNSNFDYVIRGIESYARFEDKNEYKKYKGYEGKKIAWDNTFDVFVKNNSNGVTYSIDQRTKEEFDSYLKFCIENNIKVILVYTPEYYKSQEMTLNRQEIMNIYRAYAKKYHIPLYDYSKDSICYNKSFFYNSQHLNITGAELFSKELAQDLKPLVK